MWPIEPLYPLFLTTGFTVGFGHCVGMCGPIVVSLSLSRRGKGILFPHALYHAGRIFTYGILGGLVGLSGSFTSVMSRIMGLQKSVMIFTGLMIMAMGLAMGGWISVGRVFHDGAGSGWPISKAFKKLSASKSPTHYFPLGLLLGLLPCGPVYTALIAAARTGMEAASAAQAFLKGMGLMFAFGVGTAPALIIVARLANLRWLRARDVIYKVGAVTMLLMGAYFVIKGSRY